MAWILKTFSGQTFHLDEKQKDYYLRKVNEGVKMVVFEDFVLSPNFEYLISEQQAKLEALKNNPILKDPDFVKYIHGTYEQKSAVYPMLQDRYSGPKYTQAWDEALKHKDILPELHGHTKALEVSHD